MKYVVKRFISIGRIVGPALAAVAAMGSGCSNEKPQSEVVLRPVRAQQVFATGGDRVRKFSGVARAGVESKISFKVAGTIQQIPVEVGRSVSKGQLLAQLDATDYRLQLQDAEASLAQAVAQERNQSANYERVRGLYEARNASTQDLESARAKFESAEATVKSLQKRVELARNQLAYTRLTAPIDAAVAAVAAEVNENVNAGQVIVQLTSGSDIEVQVAIPEILIAQIREGDATTVRFDAVPGREFAGRVTEVGVAATGAATTFPVTVRLDQSDPDLRSGMAVEVAFQFGSASSAERYLLPPVAIGEDNKGRFVYVVDVTEENGVGVVTRRSVTIGELTDEGLEVLDGLADGMFVVTAGVSKLVDGQRVKFNPAQEM
jgi:RND family efflux transporter MFP subunit